MSHSANTDTGHSGSADKERLPLLQTSGAESADQPSPLHGGNEHPLVDIPFTVTLDGRPYHGRGLSLVEAHVRGLPDPALDGQTRLVRLSFDFNGFSVSLQPKVRVIRGEDQLILRFTEPTGDHLPQLRYLLNEYISGDLVSLGQIIRSGSLGGPSGGKAGQPKPGFFGVLRRIAGTLAVLALTLALVGLAAMLLERRLLVTELEAPGLVTTSGETLRAVADGQISYLDPEAAEGEVVLALASTRGETLSVAMPCDCTAVPLGVSEGSTVLAGEPVLKLAGAGDAVVVEARVSAADLFAMQESGGAEIRLPDGSAVFGALAGDPVRAAAAAADGPTTVTLTPEPALAGARVGEVAALRVHREAGRLAAPLAEVWQDARDRAGAIRDDWIVPIFNQGSEAVSGFLAAPDPADAE
ncbi:hypothetical protein [Histidinibacterium lentulum]|uniref:Alginate biosynthesis protein Alg44 n=1 Tax=Histidinibacterium lentulum TaxID=2480588 RepID=A0A3N2R873_9RHOB|nr:hypothetical protein [Histidinibacterium lentulum]ROU03618.1 hypothetical protein EAT49_04800 [Histidinibacterium lentulum]